MLRSGRIRLQVILVAALLLAGAGALRAGELKVNLILEDGSLMLYSGSNQGINAGDTFTVTRDGKEIGTIEIVRVGPAYATARIVDRTGEIREMDRLARAAGAARPEKSGISKAASPDNDTPARSPDEDVSPEKNRIKKSTVDSGAKPVSRKESNDKSLSSGNTGEQDGGGKGRDANAVPTQDKKQNTKADQEAPGPAKKPGRQSTFASERGPTGLIQIPTAFIAAPNKGALCYYSEKYSETRIEEGMIGRVYARIDTTLDADVSSLSFAYGVNKNVELSFAQQKIDASIMYRTYSDMPAVADVLNNFFPAIGPSISAEFTTIGIKYNPHTQLRFLPESLAKLEYAFGVLVSEMGKDNEQPMYYTSVSIPLQSVTLHTNLYVLGGESSTGGNRGYMAGLEIPVMRDAVLIADWDRLRGESVYSAGLRYSFKNHVSAMLGLIDQQGYQGKMLNLSYNF